MNIAIVEDEAADREYLLDCLAMYADDTKAALSITTFDGAEAFLAGGVPTRYDLIFLDIYLKDGIGMTVAQKLRAAHVRSQLVFVTTSTLHAISSYEVAASYYLLKPYDYEQFTKMMYAVLNRAVKSEACLAVKVGRNMEKIPLSSILYVDYADHAVSVHTPTRELRSYVHFQDVAERLKDYPQFLSCCYNVLINMDCVDKLEGNRFVLQMGHCIPITRSRLHGVREAFSAYIFSCLKDGDAM